MVYVYLTENRRHEATETIVAELSKIHFGRLNASVEVPDAFRISRHEHGKPFFLNMPQVHFSVSHSDDIFAFAISDSPVGVDIQRLKHRADERERCRRIAARFFHPEEISAMGERSDTLGDTVAAFYKIWCGKEAYVKLSGTGIGSDFAEHSVFSLRADIRWAVYGEYTMACCTDESCRPETIDLLKENKNDTVLHSPWRPYI